jgi:hypothetical protein
VVFECLLDRGGGGLDWAVFERLLDKGEGGLEPVVFERPSGSGVSWVVRGWLGWRAAW